MPEEDKPRLPIEGGLESQKAFMKEWDEGEDFLSPRSLYEIAHLFGLDPSQFNWDAYCCSRPLSDFSRDETKIAYRLLQEISHYRDVVRKIHDSTKVD